MKCDLCDKEAVVHEVTIKNGKKTEVHLCAEHAQAAGIALPGHQPINELLTQFVISKGGKPKRTTRKACRNCGMSFAQFRQSGVVGCAECYEAFENQLGPLIERTQSGAVSHCGKCPQRGGASIDRQIQMQRLIREMEDAITAEQYERAAELRDRLQHLETQVAAGEEIDGSAEES